MSKVSILMNCYNGERYLQEAIDSIFIQTHNDWEIIFVDNCSTDNSAEIARSYNDGRLKYYKTEENISLGAARNFGLKFVKGEFLAFLDTDDIWMKNKLEKQTSQMLENNAWMSFSSVEHINQFGKVITKKIQNKDNNKLCKQLISYTINMQTVMINMNKCEFMFDETLSYAPDFKLFMSIIAESNNNVIPIISILAKYRIHSNSLSNKLVEAKYKETKSILEYLKTTFSDKISHCNKEYGIALSKCEEKKAEYLLAKGEFFEASKTFYKIKSLGFIFLIKAFVYSIPLVNILVYSYLKIKRNKRIL